MYIILAQYTSGGSKQSSWKHPLHSADICKVPGTIVLQRFFPMRVLLPPYLIIDASPFILHFTYFSHIIWNIVYPIVMSSWFEGLINFLDNAYNKPGNIWHFDFLFSIHKSVNSLSPWITDVFKNFYWVSLSFYNNSYNILAFTRLLGDCRLNISADICWMSVSCHTKLIFNFPLLPFTCFWKVIRTEMTKISMKVKNDLKNL